MSNSSKRTATIAAIIGLLCVVGILGYRNMKLSQEVATYSKSLDETTQLKEELDVRYDEAVAELEELKGSNTELNALIDKQKGELMEQRDRINTLLRSGKADKSSLAQARKEISDMRSVVDQYIADINRLKDENQLLSADNQRLSTEKTELETSLTSVTTERESLSQEKAMLVSEKEKLINVKDNLESKLTFASVVKVSNLEVTGLKTRKNGNLAKKRYAKNVDMLEVCFQTVVNETTPVGEEDYYIRLVSPTGETLAMENMGSGVLVNNADNKEVRYTLAISKEYERDAKDICLKWKPPVALSPGNYDVEVYNKGYLAGKGAFELK